MRVALLADIHSNREALDACLLHAHDQRVEQFVFLGDLVGYGADPTYVVEKVMALVRKGAIAVMGNHDAAINAEAPLGMKGDAAIAIEWTRQQLGEAHRAFLRGLPLIARHPVSFFSHASPWAPLEWGYVSTPHDAQRSFSSIDSPLICCGHVHVQRLYHQADQATVGQFDPTEEMPIHLSAQRRWLVLPGSVGRPRDHRPASCYAVFDDRTRDLTYFRIPYEHFSASEKIRAAGLPESISNGILYGT